MGRQGKTKNAAIEYPQDAETKPRASSKDRPKSLRKNTKDRGHGTLHEDDTDEVKQVDVHNLDLSDTNFSKEFGPSGLLPERFQNKRGLNLRLEKKFKTNITTFDVAPGSYVLRIKHNSLISEITGRGSIVSKVWLLNKVGGRTSFSMRSLTDTIKSGNRSVEYVLRVEETPENTESMIHVALSSQSTFRRLNVTLQLLKLE